MLMTRLCVCVCVFVCVHMPPWGCRWLAAAHAAVRKNRMDLLTEEVNELRHMTVFVPASTGRICTC